MQVYLFLLATHSGDNVQKREQKREINKKDVTCALHLVTLKPLV
jgi:hypothetical protein